MLCVCCNTLQHTATHCNTLQHTATQEIAVCCVCVVIHCNTLQHTVIHCNTGDCSMLCVCCNGRQYDAIEAVYLVDYGGLFCRISSLLQGSFAKET